MRGSDGIPKALFTFSRLGDFVAVDHPLRSAMTLAQKAALIPKGHFSVDGTLIQAWASHKSFEPEDGSDDLTPGGPGRNAQADWKGTRRGNDTRACTTDSDARPFRTSKGQPVIIAYRGHVRVENRSGLVVGAMVTHADAFSERAAAKFNSLIVASPHRPLPNTPY